MRIGVSLGRNYDGQVDVVYNLNDTKGHKVQTTFSSNNDYVILDLTAGKVYKLPSPNGGNIQYRSGGLIVDASDESGVQLSGGIFDDYLRGSAQDDTLNGGFGDDLLEGGAGADRYRNLGGTDYASYQHSTQALTIDATDPGNNTGEGTGDTYDYMPGILGTAFDDRLTAGGSVIYLAGGAGADTLDGKGQALASYRYASEGVLASLTYPNVNTGEAANDTYINIIGLAGSKFADSLFGDAGNNVLASNGGGDYLAGGGGNDRYQIVDGDTVVEAADDGIDTIAPVQTIGTYALPDNVENFITYSAVTSVTGDDQANDIRVGNGAAAGTILSGQDGNDTLVIDGGVGTMIGGHGNDYVGGKPTGFATASFEDAEGGVTVDVRVAGYQDIGGGLGIDRLEAIRGLVGGSYDDILRGAEVMSGGDGDDILVAGAKTADGSSTRFYGGEGSDTISYEGTSEAVTFNLYDSQFNAGAATGDRTYEGIENVRGGDSDDDITGNGAGNVLSGGFGDDRLDGGGGADTMDGFYGADTYIVDDAGDVIVEVRDPLAIPAVDTVRVLLNSYVVPYEIEQMIFIGTGKFVGTGSLASDHIVGGAEADRLTGRNGDDILDGQGGMDRLAGGLGDDTYVIDTAKDVVIELDGQGFDTVQAGFSYHLAGDLEGLQLTGDRALKGYGNAQDNGLTGNGAANTLSGGNGGDTLAGGGSRDRLLGEDGDDVLIGGAQRDTLTGGAGADAFRFLEGDFGRAASTADVVTDFSRADHDRIDLTAIDANTQTRRVDAFALIGTQAFSGVAGQLRYEFSGDDTLVSADRNGDAKADLFVRLSGRTALVAADFVGPVAASQSDAETIAVWHGIPAGLAPWTEQVFGHGLTGLV